MKSRENVTTVHLEIYFFLRQSTRNFREMGNIEKLAFSYGDDGQV
jgi:hypothetical protein